jgi:hypothetical protein
VAEHDLKIGETIEDTGKGKYSEASPLATANLLNTLETIINDQAGR